MAGKWAELLTEIAPRVKQVAFMFNPGTASGGGSHFLNAFETATRSAKITPIAAPVRNDTDIETVINSLGREAGGGLVIMPDGGFTNVHRGQIILLAAQNNIPALYPTSGFVRDACFPTDQIERTLCAARRPMSIASCVARSRPTYLFNSLVSG